MGTLKDIEAVTFVCLRSPMEVMALSKGTWLGQISSQ